MWLLKRDVLSKVQGLWQRMVVGTPSLFPMGEIPVQDQEASEGQMDGRPTCLDPIPSTFCGTSVTGRVLGEGSQEEEEGSENPVKIKEQIASLEEAL